MSKGGSASPPPAPNPADTVRAQAEANRIAEFTPQGIRLFGTVGPNQQFQPGSGGAATQILENPFQQEFRTLTETLGRRLANAAVDQTGTLQLGAFNPFLPAIPGVPGSGTGFPGVPVPGPGLAQPPTPGPAPAPAIPGFQELLERGVVPRIGDTPGLLQQFGLPTERQNIVNVPGRPGTADQFGVAEQGTPLPSGAIGLGTVPINVEEIGTRFRIPGTPGTPASTRTETLPGADPDAIRNALEFNPAFRQAVAQEFGLFGAGGPPNSPTNTIPPGGTPPIVGADQGGDLGGKLFAPQPAGPQPGGDVPGLAGFQPSTEPPPANAAAIRAAIGGGAPTPTPAPGTGGTGQPTGIEQSFGAERERLENAILNRTLNLINPEFERQENRLRQQLLNTGNPVTGDLARSDLGVFNDARNRAFLGAAQDAVAQGGAEQSRLFGMSQSARNQLLQEALTSRQLPFNEIASLIGAQQVAPVQIPNFAQPTPLDILGPQQLQQANQLAAFQSQQAGQQNMLSNIFGLAGAGVGALGNFFGLRALRTPTPTPVPTFF